MASFCPSCGLKASLGDIFCSSCGRKFDQKSAEISERPSNLESKVAVNCPSCFTPQFEGAATCTACGFKMQDDEANLRADGHGGSLEQSSAEQPEKKKKGFPVFRFLLISLVIVFFLWTLTRQEATPPPTQVTDAPFENNDDLGGATLGEANALSRAQTYLGTMAFSKTGLEKQLEFEGYSAEEAQYATSRVGANWNEQAALKAAEYLRSMSFSKEGLIDQLLFEGFTRSQAEYGAQAVGY